MTNSKKYQNNAPGECTLDEMHLLGCSLKYHQGNVIVLRGQACEAVHLFKDSGYDKLSRSRRGDTQTVYESRFAKLILSDVPGFRNSVREECQKITRRKV